jgi:hypothetical protein
VHTFAVVIAKPQRTIPPPTLELLRRRAVEGLAFDPEDHVVWVTPSASVAFAGWQAGTETFGVGSHWEAGQDRLTAFAGYLWPHGEPWAAGRTWGSQLQQRAATQPLPEACDAFAGVYVATDLRRDGTGCIVTDPLGLGVVYSASHDDYVVFSTRAAVAAHLAHPTGAPRRDALGVGWLVYAGYIVGGRTSFADVRAIPQGASVTFAPGQGVTVVEPDAPPWRVPEDLRGRDVGTVIRSARDDIASAVRVAATLPSRARIADLTGGKDSRLVLSVMLSEGVEGSFHFRTHGSEALPDAIIAASIAERFGLRHSVVGAGKVIAGVPPPAPPLEFEDNLRHQVWTTSAMLSTWDGVQRRALADDFTVGGLVGECLRTNYPGTSAIIDHAELADRFPRWFDAARMLTPDARRYYHDHVTRSLLGGGSEGATPQDLADEFYIRNRLRRWFGTSQEVNRSNRVVPLYSMAAIRGVFAIGSQRRHAEVLPFEVMRQCCEPLAKMPFAKDPWREAVFAHLPDADDYRPAPARPPSRSTGEASEGRTRSGAATAAPGPWRTVVDEHRSRGLERKKAVLRRLLDVDRNDPLYEVVDRDAALRAVDHLGEEGPAAHAAVYAAATAAIWLSGDEAQAIDG